jgi:hypothetical protein
VPRRINVIDRSWSPRGPLSDISAVHANATALLLGETSEHRSRTASAYTSSRLITDLNVIVASEWSRRIATIIINLVNGWRALRACGAEELPGLHSPITDPFKPSS